MKITFNNIVHEFLEEKKTYYKNIDKLTRSYKVIISLQKEIDNNEPVLSKELLNACLTKTQWECNSNMCARVSKLRSLSEYMIRMSYDSINIPKGITSNPDYAYEPYIFSNKELESFLVECDKFFLSTLINFQSRKVFPIVFRLLIGSGTRISETLNLTKNDVDIKACTIYLKKTKNNNERRIPIAKTTINLIEPYLYEITDNNILNESNLLFPNREGNIYRADLAYYYFRKILWNAKIPHLGRGKGPRLHDFRHTFAVKVLEKWVKEKHNISTALPYLATYMGHCGLKSSEHYLRLTKNMYPELLDAYTQKFDWILKDDINETN